MFSTSLAVVCITPSIAIVARHCTDWSFCVVEFRCLKVVNPMSYLTVGLLENTSRLVDVSLNWTINSTG